MKKFEMKHIMPNHLITPSHKRGYSQTAANSFSNSPEVNSRLSDYGSIDDFELGLLKKQKLVGLAVPYLTLGKKIELISAKNKELNTIKVPLIKKLPFGKHKYEDIEPKFHNILTYSGMRNLTDKKVKHVKMLSGRIK